jgi:hypothetical protein
MKRIINVKQNIFKITDAQEVLFLVSFQFYKGSAKTALKIILVCVLKKRQQFF